VQVVYVVAWALDPKATNSASSDWLQLSAANQDAIMGFLMGKRNEEDHVAMESEWFEY